jgi:hypothetical protein
VGDGEDVTHEQPPPPAQPQGQQPHLRS